LPARPPRSSVATGNVCPVPARGGVRRT
jgi:hypothetical protein